MTDYLGGKSVAGGKLKETGITHWASPNTGATNETGFTSLPGGHRTWDGGFRFIDITVTYWSATNRGGAYAYLWFLQYNASYITHAYNDKREGYSVRCVKD